MQSWSLTIPKLGMTQVEAILSFSLGEPLKSPLAASMPEGQEPAHPAECHLVALVKWRGISENHLLTWCSVEHVRDAAPWELASAVVRRFDPLMRSVILPDQVHNEFRQAIQQ